MPGIPPRKHHSTRVLSNYSQRVPTESHNLSASRSLEDQTGFRTCDQSNPFHLLALHQYQLRRPDLVLLSDERGRSKHEEEDGKRYCQSASTRKGCLKDLDSLLNRKWSIHGLCSLVLRWRVFSLGLETGSSWMPGSESALSFPIKGSRSSDAATSPFTAHDRSRQFL